jgi:hypothetical protein
VKRRNATAWLALAGTAALCACATPPGPDFPGLTVPPTAYGHLYIYRPDVWFTAGAAVPVHTGPVREHDLHNGSYLRLKLAPGRYVVDVNGATQRVAIVGGFNHFLEFDVSKSTLGVAAVTSNQLATTLTERGELRVRSEADAVNALRRLRQAGEPGN